MYISLLMEKINEVVSICLELVQQTKVSPSDIGVIAAFRQQVLKIRLQLRQQGLSNVNVGSVEDFQVRNSLSLSLYFLLFLPLSFSLLTTLAFVICQWLCWSIGYINLYDDDHSEQHHIIFLSVGPRSEDSGDFNGSVWVGG